MLRWGREHQAKEKEVFKEKRELAWSKKDRAFLFSGSLFGEFLFDRFEGLFG